MTLLRSTLSCLTVTTMVFAICPVSLPAAEDGAQEAYFENHVRPLLVTHCAECHGASKQQGEVRLDARKFVFDRKDGPLVVAGKPDESRILQVLKFDAYDVQMPPDGKLPAEAIAVVRKWIADGAYWPESDAPIESTTSGPLSIADAQAGHWAFQPISAPPVPDLSEQAEALSPVDRFLLRKLSAAGLAMSPAVDRAKLIRRTTLDLWGIPPTAEQVAEFANDARPDAYSRLVDKLLASPLYGQRWARHWLDVARYSDTKGYVFTQEPRYPFAYTYRDYVVDAFNEDLPFDRFVTEQLAADLDPPPTRENQSLAALGFLTVGRRFLNNGHDIIDDRIDVVSRGLMGLTVGCARCHDHKYDPIPTADYYSLYGVFASVSEPERLPLLGDPTTHPGYATYKAELDKRTAARDAYVAGQRDEMESQARRSVGDYLLAVAAHAKTGAVPEKPPYAHGEPMRGLIERWTRYLKKRNSADDPVFGIWNRFHVVAPDAFAEQWGAFMAMSERPPVNPLIEQAIQIAPPTNATDLANVYGNVFAHSQTAAEAKPDAPLVEPWLFLGTAIETPAFQELRAVLDAEDSPVKFNADEAFRMFNRAQRDAHRNLDKKIDEWDVTSPDAPPRAMIVEDKSAAYNPVIFERGNPGRRGAAVPRRFLQVLSDDDSGIFQKGSGRLELARAVASPDNPLTARVLVNRVWMHHFHEGLVRTPSDFGVRGEPPTHPELLTYLAAEFIRHDWSLKWLHRELMLTHAYQQSSGRTAEGETADPENRLLWRMHTQRLDLEAMRDSILFAAGNLDRSLSGRPVDIVKNADERRRTIYGFVSRNDTPSMFAMFDFADVDATTALRPRTTVPQQALFLMNSPFLLTQSEATTEAVLRALPDDVAANDANVVAGLYRKILSREPSPEESERAAGFLQSAGTGTPEDRRTAMRQLAQVLFLTNEFFFVD